MEIIADTNVLVRAIVADDPNQAAAAQKALLSASIVAVSPIALCELYWVLSRAYKVPDADIETAIRGLINAANVRTDTVAVDAGLMFMNNGGDFADGVLWHMGIALGGKTFVSFDKKAANILKAQKASVKLMQVKHKGLEISSPYPINLSNFYNLPGMDMNEILEQITSIKVKLCTAVVLADTFPEQSLVDLTSAINDLRTALGASWSFTTAYQFMSGSTAKNFILDVDTSDEKPIYYLAHLVSKLKIHTPPKGEKAVDGIDLAMLKSLFLESNLELAVRDEFWDAMDSQSRL